MSNKISLVCPVKDSDWDRFDILSDSLKRHMKIDYKLITISPSGKCPIKNKKIVSYSDEDIVPGISDHKFKNTGWWKQQLLKLVSYKVCSSEIIIILDADCFMVKDMYLSDIIDSKNRIKIKISSGGSWDNWYHGSSKILNLPFDYKHQRIGVTPNILSKTILNNLYNYLTIIYDDPNDYLLSHIMIYDTNFEPHDSPTWTEYCMYHIYGVHSKLWDKYHVISDIDLSGNSFWNKEQAEEWDVKKSFDNPSFYFTVAQSIAGQSAEWVKNKIQNYL